MRGGEMDCCDGGERSWVSGGRCVCLGETVYTSNPRWLALRAMIAVYLPLSP